LQDKLTPRQSRAWGLCALSVPAAMALAGRGWLWVLAGSAAASGIVLFLQTLQRRSGQSLPEQMARAFGRRGGAAAPGLSPISAKEAPHDRFCPSAHPQRIQPP